MIQSESCVEGELELEEDSAILHLATRWCPRTAQLPESWVRGCGWNHLAVSQPRWVSSASLDSTCLWSLSPRSLP